MMGNPYEGTEFWRFRHGLEQLTRLREAALDVDLVWVLPDDVFAGATEVYGLRVIRADVPGPLLAHFTVDGSEEQEDGRERR